MLALINIANCGEIAEYDNYADFFDPETLKSLGDAEDYTFNDAGTIIGHLGITHRLEDDALVEITPAYKEYAIHKDDVVMSKPDGTGPWTVDCTFNPTKYTRYISLLSFHKFDFSEDEVEKIGVLGVNYEYINDNLLEEN